MNHKICTLPDTVPLAASFCLATVTMVSTGVAQHLKLAGPARRVVVPDGEPLVDETAVCLDTPGGIKLSINKAREEIKSSCLGGLHLGAGSLHSESSSSSSAFAR
jgi:hypothetical protein